MKFKALRTKKEPKEFITIEYIDGENMLFTHELPTPMPMTVTMEGLKKYFKINNPLSESVNLDSLELVTFEMIEIN